MYRESSLVPEALSNNRLPLNSCAQGSATPANQNHQPIPPVLPELPAILPQNMHVHSHQGHQCQPVVAYWGPPVCFSAVVPLSLESCCGWDEKFAVSLQYEDNRIRWEQGPVADWRNEQTDPVTKREDWSDP